MQLVPIRNKFVYPKLKRLDLPTGRVYTLDGCDPVPSVTTVSYTHLTLPTILRV